MKTLAESGLRAKDKVEDIVKARVEESLDIDSIKNAVDFENLDKGDRLVFNNTFLLRKRVPTNKSDLYLGIESKKDDDVIKVFKNENGQNKDVKIFDSRANSITDIELSKAIDRELEDLGFMIFILVEEVQSGGTFKQKICKSQADYIKLNPEQEDLVIIEDGIISVQNTIERQDIWREIKQVELVEEDDWIDFRDKLNDSLEKIEKKAFDEITISPSEIQSENTILTSLIAALEKYQHNYREALNLYKKGEEEELNTMLRISHNFSNDVIDFLRLLVSICDLKPLVLWCTLPRYIEIAQAFNEVPTMSSLNKASLGEYKATVGNARNQSFHDTFKFDKDIKVNLPDQSISNPKLRIFSEYNRKNSNELQYEDKELVKVLLEFTRSKFVQTPDNFWEKNLEVIGSMINLLEDTQSTLHTLYSLKANEN